LGALIQTVPHKPATLPQRGAFTSQTQINLLITKLTGLETGGSPLTSYVVYWDKGLGGALSPLIGDNVNQMQTEFLFINGVTSGTNYRFTYAARNIHGTGAQSDELTVVAATVPAQMNTPVVTL
jgi:hypothetical protein